VCIWEERCILVREGEDMYICIYIYLLVHKN
jgi:hypothetical protein